MTLPSGVPITLQQIQAEYAVGSLSAAAVAAGIATLSGTDLQPDKTMQDFFGRRNYALSIDSSSITETSGSNTCSLTLSAGGISDLPTFVEIDYYIFGSGTVNWTVDGGGNVTSDFNVSAYSGNARILYGGEGVYYLRIGPFAAANLNTGGYARTILAIADSYTEGSETYSFTLCTIREYGGSNIRGGNYTYSLSNSVSVTISDTSLTPTLASFSPGSSPYSYENSTGNDPPSANTYIDLTFTNQGVVSVTDMTGNPPEVSNLPTQWFSPTGGGIGATYDIKITSMTGTVTGGSRSYYNIFGGGNTGVNPASYTLPDWLSLSSNQTIRVGIGSSPTSLCSAGITVQIAIAPSSNHASVATAQFSLLIGGI